MDFDTASTCSTAAPISKTDKRKARAEAVQNRGGDGRQQEFELFREEMQLRMAKVEDKSEIRERLTKFENRMNNISEKANYVPVFINFSAQTSSQRTQEMIESKLEKKKRTVFGKII